MSDRPLRSGWGGFPADRDESPNPATRRTMEEAKWACQDARATYLEVMGDRLERERRREADEQARRDGKPASRSSFL